jgi:predicted GNAT family acetyltransferase
MTVTEHVDARALWRVAESFLSGDPANHTHQLGVLNRLMDRGAKHGEQFFSINKGADVVGSAVIVDTRTLFLSTMPEAATSAIAQHLLARGIAIAGVLGRQDALDTFAKTYVRPHKVYVELMLYQLMNEPEFGRAGGYSRVATAQDLGLLVAWQEAFEKEIDAIAVPTPLIERLQRRIEDQQLIIWFDRNAPVAYAGLHRVPAASARIGPVYTPPELRARGYAQAVVAAASVEAARDQPRTVFLFTDAAYPASNKAYQRIGFKHIADHAHWLY